MRLSFPSYHPKETDDKPGSRCWKRLFNQPKWLFFPGVSRENYVVKSRWAHNQPQSNKCNKMRQKPPAKACLSLGSSVCLPRHHRAEIYNSGNAGGQQRVKETRKSWQFLVHSGVRRCRSYRLGGAKNKKILCSKRFINFVIKYAINSECKCLFKSSTLMWTFLSPYWILMRKRLGEGRSGRSPRWVFFYEKSKHMLAVM